MQRDLERSMRELGYELVEILGAGGMGQVWRARELSLDRMVAIKFIDASKLDADVRRRFLTEARALARIQHANVVTVYSLGEVEGQPFLSYELVEGVGVEQLTTSVTWQRAVEIGLDLARGLAAAHQAGVLHRDLKPANAMVTREGVAKLLDFGLAKLVHADSLNSTDDEGARLTPLDRWLAGHSEGSSDGSTEFADETRELSVDSGAEFEFAAVQSSRGLTQTGALLGTPRYIAPELWLGKPASERTDVYALGLIVWELLAKQLAHADGDRFELPRTIVDEPLPPLASLRPELPGEFAAIIDQAVAKRPGDRFDSAAALAAALEQAIETLQALGRLPRKISAELSESEASAVAASLARALADGSFVPRFYARLFVVEPRVRPLFPNNLREQAQKLADALRLAVAMLREPAELARSLEELGARHVLYGVREPHLDVARDVLFELLIASEGEAMTEELRGSWVRAWAALDESFRRGMRRAAQAFAAPSVAPTVPATRWIWAGKTSIATQTFGSGPTPLIFIPAWVSHCEIAWRLPEYAAFMTELGELARVTVIDKRGTGMSDRASATASLDERLEDVLATIDALELDSAVLFGVRETGMLAASLAALRPERVRGLIWYAPGRRVLVADNPDGMSVSTFAATCESIERDWGGPLLADLLAPSRAHEPEFLRWWADYLRNGASPTVARALLEHSGWDDPAVLPRVDAPTLLVHRTDDRSISPTGVRAIAGELDHARRVELPGVDHLPWIGDRRPLLAAVAEFLATLASVAPPRARSSQASDAFK